MEGCETKNTMERSLSGQLSDLIIADNYDAVKLFLQGRTAEELEALRSTTAHLEYAVEGATPEIVGLLLTYKFVCTHGHGYLINTAISSRGDHTNKIVELLVKTLPLSALLKRYLFNDRWVTFQTQAKKFHELDLAKAFYYWEGWIRKYRRGFICFQILRARGGPLFGDLPREMSELICGYIVCRDDMPSVAEIKETLQKRRKIGKE